MDPKTVVQHTITTKPCCPGCLIELENVIHNRGDVPPPVGAIIVCAHCAAVLKLTENFHWQRVVEADLAHFSMLDRITLNSMVAYVRKYRAQND